MTASRLLTSVALASLSLMACTPPASVAYLPDPTLSSPGWQCPSDRKFIPHANPPCAWIPGGLMFKSCWDRYIADISEARGCVRSAEAKAAAPPPGNSCATAP